MSDPPQFNPDDVEQAPQPSSSSAETDYLVEDAPSLDLDVKAEFETPVNPAPALIDSADAPPASALEAAASKQGGIEILVHMAEKGEIDPKNIDIIDVTDRFLRAIAAAPKENLRQSGKILFHASVLLRMKAEALLALATDDSEDFALDDFMEFDENGSPIIYDSRSEPVARQITLQDLERALVRRVHSKQFRQRKVTLEQLIEALREAERIENARSEKRHPPRIDLEGQHEINDVGDILELAHGEDIEEVIERIEDILNRLLNTNDLMPLFELVRHMKGGGDWVDAFLGLLFLSNAGKITLEQPEFYGPLYIARADRESQATQGEPATI